MDRTAILARFDAEMREGYPPEEGYRKERVGSVVRLVGDRSSVIYSRLQARDAAEAVREQTEFFRDLGRPAEWKLHGHDLPPNLGEILASFGYVPDPTETLELLDLQADHSLRAPSPPVEVRRVEDARELETAVRLSREAFGTGEGWEIHGDPASRLSDPRFAAFLAYVDGTPAAAGRMDLPPGRAFASLWGGGTVPRHRGRGVYRALVYARAAEATRRGYRYLTVDARETSRPILERLGFVPLTSLVGWVLTPETTDRREPAPVRK